MPVSKFDGIDFTSHEVIELNPDQENLGGGFRCSRGEFVAFIRKGKIINEINCHITRCWIIQCDQGLAAYITLLADKLSMGSPILMDELVNYSTFPAVKIGWLAADQRASKSGTRLVEWAIEYVSSDLSGKLGIRFLTVDALYDIDANYDASGFYEKIGFRFVDPEEELPPKDGYRSMYFDLKPMIDALRSI